MKKILAVALFAFSVNAFAADPAPAAEAKPAEKAAKKAGKKAEKKGEEKKGEEAPPADAEKAPEPAKK